MSSSHLFYIPLILAVGLALGTVIGRRTTLAELEEEEQARRSREASDARARRDAGQDREER